MSAQSDETKTQQYGRPLSIEDYSNRFFVHPLSALVVKFAVPLKISANAVSLAGLFAGLLAGVLYYYQANRLFVFGAFAAMVLWHILDGADGRIARATGTSSSFGRILDGVCDHLVFASVYFAFVFYILHNGGGNFVWVLAIASTLSHIVQAAGYEERRQVFQRRSRGLDRQDMAENLVHVDGKKSFLAMLYDAFQKISSPRTSILDVKLKQMREAGASLEQTQTLVNQTVPMVRVWALLNANNRTLMLAITALIGQPVLYFIYEMSVLNLVFFGLIIWERQNERKIIQNFEASNPA